MRKRIYVYGLTDEKDEEFVEWFEEEFYVPAENWTYLEEGSCHMDMKWATEDCKNVANHIKQNFPETRVEVFEFTMNTTPFIKL